MARRRFIVEDFSPGRVRLSGAQEHHLAHVLRVRPGQIFELSDGREVWLGKVSAVEPGRVDFELVERLAEVTSAPRLVLLVAVVKFNRFELLLEKAAELGVTTVAPLAAARSVGRLVSAAPARSDRWKKILLGAAQQSRRAMPPEMEPLRAPADAFGQVEAQAKILLAEGDHAPLLKTVLQQCGTAPASAALAVGPEGGWTEEERAAARAAGFCEASLGGNILRTETAALAALAILSHELAAASQEDEVEK